MPRVARVDVGGYPYHVINRAVMRLPIFTSDEEYLLFEQLLFKTSEEMKMRVLAFVLMPNHWHLLLYPEDDGDLGLFMHRLTNAHTRQVRSRTGTIGTGPLYQGRYKSFLIEEDTHCLAVLKYIERNPVRAKLVSRSEKWRWGSAWHRLQKKTKKLAAMPVPIPRSYLSWVNAPEPSEELNEIRKSVVKGVPYGRESWVERIIDRFGLYATLRNPGRPKK